MKNLIQTILGRFNYGLRTLPAALSPSKRPVGDIVCFLEDIKRRGFSPKHILDVGAHDGLWTQNAARIFPEASFLMVEPQADLRPKLQAACALNSKLSCEQVALGSKNGPMTMNIYGGDGSGTTLLSVRECERYKIERSTEVDLKTISSLYSERAPLPDLVKIDVQGFELEVLRGADILFRVTDIFILEICLYDFLEQMPILSDVVGFMDRVGYQAYDIPGFSRRPRDGALGVIDIAFARDGCGLRQSNHWD